MNKKTLRVFLTKLKGWSLYALKYLLFLGKFIYWEGKRLIKKYPRYAALVGILLSLLFIGLAFRTQITTFLNAPRPLPLSEAPKNSGFLYSVTDKKTQFSAYIGATKFNQPEVKAEFAAGKSVSFVLTETKQDIAPPAKRGNSVLFKNVRNDVDLEYQTLTNGIKENIIVKKKQEGNAFTFVLNATDASPRQIAPDTYGSVFYDAVGNYVFHFAKPYAIDATGARTDNVVLSLHKKPDENNYTMTVIVNQKWLEDPARVYPVTIDPTLVYSSSSQFAAGTMNRVTDTIADISPTTAATDDTGTVSLFHFDETTSLATGGTVTYVGSDVVHTFTTSGTFTPTFSGNVQALVVGGGGGAGALYQAGGGGGGGVVYHSGLAVTPQAYTVTVGGGGSGSAVGAQTQAVGQNSSFSTITAYGGGRGGSESVARTNGGSGGGGAHSANYTGGTATQGAGGTTMYGSNGGGGGTGNAWQAGGGGGAGGVGGTATTTSNGGIGMTSSISGVSTYYGGGGAGSNRSATVWTGGTGGGGNTGVAGTANTGGGGGGGTHSGASYIGGAGGSGIVIIRYPLATTTTDSDAQAPQNGTLSGTSIVSGVFGNARSFNGSTDYIDLGNPAKLGSSMTGNQTIEMWLYPTDFSARRNPYAKAYGGEGTITQETDGTLTYFYGTAGGNGLPYQGFSSGTAIPLGKWSHIAIVRDLDEANGGAKKQLKWYINGALVSETAASFNAAVASSLNAYIGKGYVSNYAGYIDDVKISNIARTAAQIAADAAPRTPQLITNYQELASDHNTVGLWHMNESSGNAVDSSGNGNTGTPTGTTVVSGMLNNARRFNGTSDFITLGQTGLPTGSSPRTLEAWVYLLSEPSTYSWVVAYGNAAAGQANCIGFTTDTIYYCGYAGNDLTFSTDLAAYTGKWTHLAGVYDGSTAMIYLNGNLVASAAKTWNTVLNKAYIGRQVSDSQYFNGHIDEVRISNVARSPEEIRMAAQRRPYGVYTSDVMDLQSLTTGWNNMIWTELGVGTGDGETPFSTANRIGQWNFNENTSTTTAANAGSCGAPCQGTLTGFSNTTGQDALAGSGWTAANGRWPANSPAALMFDGTNDTVQIGTEGAFDFENNEAFTLAAWIKTSSKTQQQIISKLDPANSLTGWELQKTAAGQLKFNLINTNPTNSIQVTANTLIDDGKWHYVVSTYDGTAQASGVKLYVDGKLEPTTTAYNTLSASVLNNLQVYIGSRGNTNTFFNGVIDTPAVYTRALSASEILSNYNATNLEVQTRTGTTTDPNDGTWEDWKPTTSETVVDTMDGPYQYNTTDSGLISYWSMDETVNDSCSGGQDVCDSKTTNHGTATGAPIVDGKFGKARNFNGTSDVINIPSTLIGSGNYAIEMWVNIPTASDHGCFIRIGAGGGYGPCVGVGATTAENNGNDLIILYESIRWIDTNKQIGTGWHHVVVNVDGSGYPSAYIDGVLKYSDTGAAPNAPNAGNTQIGGYTANRYFNGSVDEVRVYSNTLTASTIQQHFTEGSTNANFLRPSTDTIMKNPALGNSASYKIQTGQPPVDANTVALWHLDETGGTGNYFIDASGRGNNASLGSPSGGAVIKGVSGKGLFAKSGYNNRLSIADSDDWNFGSGDFSLDYWINFPTSVGNPDYTFIQWSAGNDWRFYYAGTNWTFHQASPAIDFNFSWTPKLNQWYHVALTKRSNAYSLYVNGAQVGASQTDTDANADIVGGLLVGYNLADDTYLDEVRIKKGAALSPTEIAETYRMGRDHYINRTLTGTDLSAKQKLAFNIAADRPGTYLSATIGNNAYVNYQPDVYTVGLWHLENINNQSSFNATGGTITTSGGYTIHTFTGNGTFTPTVSGNVQALVVGGGGGGGGGLYHGGGGGAGGVLYNASLAVTAQAYSVTVGNGGNGGVGGGAATSGGNSVFSTMTALGGGFGGKTGSVAANGGSGGGAGYCSSPGQGTGGQGNNGGSCYGAAAYGMGGGGGAGAAGANGTSGAGGKGGDGIAYSISGVSTYYGGGGGGAHGEGSGTPGLGGLGGGGAGSVGNATSGTANTGGGGGGAERTAQSTGGNGGSGIVIIRYPQSEVDSSGNSNNGSTMGTAQSQGKIGKGRSFNGTTDYIDVPNSTVFDTQNFTISAWTYASNYAQNGFIFEKGPVNSQYSLFFEAAGGIVQRAYNSGGANCMNVYTTLAAAGITNNAWNHVVSTYDGSYLKLYVNGTLVKNTAVSCTLRTGQSGERIGAYGGSSPSYFFNGILDEVRVDTTARSAADIRAAYEIGARTHPITVDFAAKLDSSGTPNLIADINDTSFRIDATYYGLSQKGSNLYPGDDLIIRENYNGTSYIAQASVSGILASTGETTVALWKPGSTFPSSGFTANADVFKWQREYFDLNSSLGPQRNGGDGDIMLLSLRQTNGIEGRTLWLDDVRSVGGYLSTPTGSDITSTTGNRYAQFRIIESTSDYNVSASLTSTSFGFKTDAPEPASMSAATVQSHDTIRWNFTHNEVITNEKGYRILDTAGTVLVESANPSATYIDEGGLTPNTTYTRKVAAYNDFGNSPLFSTNQATATTWAEKPPAATGSATATTLQINNVSAGYRNPQSTLLTFYLNDGAVEDASCGTSGNKYVGAGGAFQASPTWQTAANWNSSPPTISGLNLETTQYTLCAKAMNSAGVITDWRANATSGGHFPISGDMTIIGGGVAVTNTLPDFHNGSRYVGGLDLGPVGWWKMDEASGNALDSSGNAFTGTPTGTSVVAGKYGSARSFNGTISDYVTVSDTTALRPTKITVSAWVKLTENQGCDTEIVNKYGGNYIGFKLGLFDGSCNANPMPYFYIGSASNSYAQVLSNENLTPGSWYYLTGTWDGSYARIYINGVLKNSVQATAVLGHDSTPVVIGKHAWDTGGNFKGSIDDVRIYNTALSQHQIQTDMNANLSPLAWWQFNEASGDAVDASDNGFTGTPTGTTVVAGKYGTARSFNATNSDHVQAVQAADPTAYTIEAWVKPSSTTSRNIITRTSGSGPTAAWSHQLRINSAGQFEHYTYDGASKSVAGTTVVQANTWYHVAGTATNNGDMHLYVNGKEEGPPTQGAPVAIGTLWTGGDRWDIGSNSGNNMGFFNGLIDDVHVYQEALTSNQITRDMRGVNNPQNVSRLTMKSGSLTVNANQTFAVGEILSPTDSSGVLFIASGGEIKPGAPIWYSHGDADNDGYTVGDSTKLVAGQKLRLAKRRFLGVPSNPDCNDTDANIFLSHSQCYADVDKDTHTNGLQANTTCLNTSSCDTATKAGGSTGSATTYEAGQLRNAASANTDCYDLNNNAYYNSAYCSSTNRGDGSFDYNCKDGPTQCAPLRYTGYNDGCQDTGATCGLRFGGFTVSGTLVGCGVTGYVAGTYWSCSDSWSCNKYQTQHSGYLAVNGAPATCQ